MTIYKSRPQETKDDKNIPEPEVVTEPLTKKVKDEEEDIIPPPTLVTITARRRRSNCANLCVLLTALFVLATGILGGIYLYKHLAQRTFSGWCSVRYYEYQDESIQNSPDAYAQRGRHRRKHIGHFEEKVEIDKIDGQFEKIEVPEFDECKKATILHDFEKNLTAIVDKDHFRCFVMPLNRTVVKPPKDFWDMLSKLSSGYYMPDVEVVRERFRVRQPPLDNLSMYGYHIWRECHRFTSYMLERMGENDPIAMVKRSVEPREIAVHSDGMMHETFPGAVGTQYLVKAEIYGL